jgi:regulatory protein YycH of two-component signal transduction system YycFG
MSDEQTEKNEHIVEYIRDLFAIEQAMEPYKDQKRELRKHYRDNGYLNTDEIRLAVKAYRLVQSDFDMEELLDMYQTIITGGSKKNDDS